MDNQVIAFIITGVIVVYVVNTIIGKYDDVTSIHNIGIFDNLFCEILFFILPIHLIHKTLFGCFFVALISCWVWIPILIYQFILWLL